LGILEDIKEDLLKGQLVNEDWFSLIKNFPWSFAKSAFF